jgi:hypothetical protein
VMDVCRQVTPELIPVQDADAVREVACHLY